MPLQRLSQEEGISIGTLSRWRAEARARGKLLPDDKADPEGRTARDKFAAVIETAALVSPPRHIPAATGWRSRA
jgi:transposase